MVDEGALDLVRADAVPGDVHHVVDPAEQPVVAVGVPLRAVAGEVHAGKAAPVDFLKPLGVLVERARHRRPRLLEDQVTAVRGVALLVDDVGFDAWKRARRRARLQRGERGKRRDHDRAGLGLPPGVDDRAAAAPDVLVVPDPGFGIDRLADRAEQSQR